MIDRNSHNISSNSDYSLRDNKNIFYVDDDNDGNRDELITENIPD